MLARTTPTCVSRAICAFELADGTDQSRVPADLTDAIEAAAKQAHSLDVWPLVPDRGESYRAGVEYQPSSWRAYAFRCSSS